MAGQQQQTGIIAGINVTPLVDVVLVLLIIFIVTSKVVSTPALDMDLPAAASGSEVQVVFSVMIDAIGQTTIDGVVVPDDTTFLRMSSDAKTKDSNTRAVIHADGAVPHRRVIHALDLLKRSGLQHVAFATVPE